MKCIHLIRVKGHGADWCSRFACIAKCDSCRYIAKIKMYGAGGPARLTEKEKRIWNDGKWDSLWQRIKRLMTIKKK